MKAAKKSVEGECASQYLKSIKTIFYKQSAKKA